MSYLWPHPKPKPVRWDLGITLPVADVLGVYGGSRDRPARQARGRRLHCRRRRGRLPLRSEVEAVSWFSALLRLFRKPPAVMRWDLGITVSPSSAAVLLTVDDETTVTGEVESADAERAQVILHLADPPTHRDWGGTLRVSAPGYRASIARVNVGHTPRQLDPVTLAKARPDPQPRSPLVLPPCASCPTPTSYDKDLGLIWTNARPPRERDFLRADAWGVEVAGLPFVPGGSSEHPERVLTYFFDLYPAAWQQSILDAHWVRGYTHFVLSWPDSRERAGRSLSQFVATCQRVKAYGFYVHVKLGSKDFDPRDQTLAQWQAALDPVLDALFAAQAIDEASFWEYDSFNTDGQPAIDVHKYFGRRCHEHGVSFWCHFLPEHGFWCPEGYAFWWNALGADVDGLDYQADSGWDVGELQSRLVDNLKRLGTAHKLRAFELTASRQFSGDHPTEDEANAIGFCALCTRGPQPVYGFNNGARARDGSVL